VVNQAEWKERVLEVLQLPLVTVLSVLVTLWALLGDDIRSLAVSGSQDHLFLPATIICIAYFTLETGAPRRGAGRGARSLTAPAALLSLCRRKYFLNFYFWLDVLSTLSLFFDVPAIYNLAVHNVSVGASPGTGGTLTILGSTVNAAAKAGQILRLVRLVRTSRAFQATDERPPESLSVLGYVRRTASLFRSGSSASSLDARRRVAGTVVGAGGERSGTRLGVKLSDLTTRRVICGVWCILLFIPLFDYSIYPISNPNTFERTGLANINEVWGVCSADGNATLPAAPCAAFSLQLVDNYARLTRGLVSLNVMGADYTQQLNLSGIPASLRQYELLQVTVGASTAVFDRSTLYSLSAGLHLGRCLFLILMLTVGVVTFSRDADRLVLQPIERMMRKVEEISANPLIGLHPVLKEAEAEASATAENYETRILELSINKICSLMVLGFGDAGAEVIGENMRNGGALNPMVPGKKKCAIFGFCDIRHFTDATEVLQEDVMEFVNAIARIVHTEVTQRKGSANKNIGDAFLLVWKFPSDVTPEDVTNIAAGKQPRSEEARAAAAAVADSALAAFVAIAARLRHSSKLAQFCAHPGLAARLPGFTVRLGFGLHVGWAIEGAIGSEYKVDASYLSPHVNIASRLEAATKQYGVPMLLSEHFARLLSPSVRDQCRTLDRVTLKGSAQPLGLVTYDTEPAFIAPPAPVVDSYGRLRAAAALPRRSSGRQPGASQPDLPPGGKWASGAEELARSGDLQELRRTVTPAFLDAFRAGYELYSAGRWAEAREALSGTLEGRVWPAGVPSAPDGPSAALLSAMAAHGYKAPPGWEGYRELTEK